MSRAAECCDNAFMESCFGELKRELEMTQCNSYSEARTEIGEYIRYYSFGRKHSALEYLKPAQLENIINQPELEDDLSAKTSPPQAGCVLTG